MNFSHPSNQADNTKLHQKLHQQCFQFIQEYTQQSNLKERYGSLLFDLCALDTTPHPDPHVLATREADVFTKILPVLQSFHVEQSRIEKHKIDGERIAAHPAFSLLHYTKTPDNPEGVHVTEAYAHRYNLLYLLDFDPYPNGTNLALNAHIDTVAPFFPPYWKKDALFGRGAIDDKGNVVAILGALETLDALAKHMPITLRNKLTCMFVVEEETGGNGSLSLALDVELKERYDSLLVLECTEKKIHPANRGAIWFACNLKINESCYPALEANKETLTSELLEAMACGIRAMQDEGMQIKAESNHALFPHKPVQTCNGILGPYGEHPSRICGYLSMDIKGIDPELLPSLESSIQEGLDSYIQRYGDKTQVIDPQSNQPKLDHHLDMEYLDSDSLRIKVWGTTGHMGSLPQNDAAITKWAYLVSQIVDLKQKTAAAFTLCLTDEPIQLNLWLEGGQGFLPTHSIESIQARLVSSFNKGIEEYSSRIQKPASAYQPRLTFDKLHNAAFDGDPDSPTMKRALQAGMETQLISIDDPIRGWDVSCDARLFAHEYPLMPVLTSGIGSLSQAHSNDEHCYLPDLLHYIQFLTLFILYETGSLETDLCE